MSRSSTSSSEAKRPRRWLRAWLVAFALLAGAELGLRRLESGERLAVPKEWHALLRLREFDEKAAPGTKAACVLLGDSMIGAFDEEALREAVGDAAQGDAVLRAGFPGATTRAARFAAEELILPRLSPRLLVYGITTQAANANGLRRRQEQEVIRDLGSINRSRGAWDRSWWLYDHLALYRQQWTLRAWITHPWRIRLRKPGGAAPKPGSWKAEKLRYVYDAERRFSFDERSRQNLRDLAKRCRETGTKLALCLPPLPDDYGVYWKEGWTVYAGFVKELTMLARELEVPLLDLRKTPFAREEFVDGHHLTPEGAARASRRVGEWIRREALLR